MDGGRAFTSHVSVALAFETPAFRGAVSGDVTESLAPMALLTSAAHRRPHRVSASSTESTSESPSSASASAHSYGFRAIAGDVPIFFTAVTIFDDSIFTRFWWLGALAGNMTVGTAIVTHCTVRAVTRYVTLFGAFVTQTIFRHDWIGYRYTNYY